MEGGKGKIQFRYRRHEYGAVSQHYDSENIVLTHEWNALSLVIPAGERFFVRSVKRFESRAVDPDLQLQIRAFIAQEAMHAKETERSFELFEKHGISMKIFERRFERIIRFLERIAPAKLLLAATAGIEHYTAILSLWHLGTRYCDRMPDAFRNLIQWHGAEELEHKAVAFNLLQVVSPRNYLLRIAGFVLGLAVVWAGMVLALRMLLKAEGLKGAELRAERRRARAIRFALTSPAMPHFFSYLRPGFHPDDLDDHGLAEQFLAEQASRMPASGPAPLGR